MNSSHDLSKIKDQLQRIDSVLDGETLVIGGLAVNQYIPTRSTRDIDLVCDRATCNSIIDQLYESKDWTREDTNDDDHRPSFEIKHRHDPSQPQIHLGPKILERDNYPFLDWEYLQEESKPFHVRNDDLIRLRVPSIERLCFSKVISFVGRDRGQHAKLMQDLHDVRDLSNHPSFGLNQFLDCLRRDGALALIQRRFEERLSSEDDFIDAWQSSSIYLVSTLAHATASHTDSRHLPLDGAPTRSSEPAEGHEGSEATNQLDAIDLIEMLGADRWARQVSHESSVRTHLSQVRTSLKFMGFGFQKYINFRPAAGEATLEEVIERCHDTSPSGEPAVKLLLMNPFSPRIRDYSGEGQTEEELQEVREGMLDALNYAHDLIERGFNVEVRHYPDSMEARASFRLFMANDERLYVSYYKNRHASATEVGGFPELVINRSRTDESFFLAFHGLFNYLWENGESAAYGTLHSQLRTSDLTDAAINDVWRHVTASTKAGSMDLERTVVAGVAGKDSMASILETLRQDDVDFVVPLIVRVPTEDKDWRPRLETLAALRRKLRAEGMEHMLTSAIVLEDDAGIWRYVNRDFQSALDGSLSSPCVGCHTYIHGIRCFLASRFGVRRVISGDRELHETTVKLNQVGDLLDLFAEYAWERFRVQLLFPLRNTTADSEVWELLNGIPSEDVKDLSCFFSGKGSVSSLNAQRVSDIVSYVNLSVVPKLDTRIPTKFRSVADV